MLALVDELMRRHPIDPARVYALGFSMGASAAMDAAVARPGLFAAMVALSGVPPERSLARAVAHVPTLLIHGDYDQENAYVGAQVWAEELAAAGSRPSSSPMSAWTIACRRSCSPTAPGANGCSSSASALARRCGPARPWDNTAFSSAPVIHDSHVQATHVVAGRFSSPMHGEGNGPAVPRPDVASAGGAPGRAAQA